MHWRNIYDWQIQNNVFGSPCPQCSSLLRLCYPAVHSNEQFSYKILHNFPKCVVANTRTWHRSTSHIFTEYSTDLSEAFSVQLVTFVSSLQSKIAKLYLWKISRICWLWNMLPWLQLSHTSFLRCYFFSPCQSQSQLLKDHSQRCALLRVTYGTPWGKIDFEHWHYSASKPSRHS